MKIVVILFPFMICLLQVHAQSCTVLGQTPTTAFPICGIDTFSQNTVPICLNHAINVPGCSASNAVIYGDKNPFWYKFTCYASGTLGFLITPNDLGDDYDWQIFDITGHDPSEVYINTSLFVIGNWSGSYGLTGASAAGTSVIECASQPAQNVPTFSKMPSIIQGHTYLLMVSHFTDSQSGYKLSFGGGTASITDDKLPDLQNAKSSCDGTIVTIALNKKMKCSSLAADGSDFTITPALATITSARGGNSCSTGFDMDSAELTLSNPLPAGNYKLTIKNGTDNNTLLDNCDRNIRVGNNIRLAILPIQPTPMDSLTAVTCAPGKLQLVFRKNIRCSSIAADGSDFIIKGPSPVIVSSAAGNCNSGMSAVVTIQLTAPVTKGGVYQVQLVKGSDGNTLLDECGQETPAGSTLNFATRDTVSALFSYQLLLGCKADTIAFSHDGRNNVNQWFWRFDAAGASTKQNPAFEFKTFGKKQIFLKVSNDFCSDSVTQTISLDNQLKASFETNNILCPEDAANFKNSSIGNIIAYNWDFGNGTTSMLNTPQAQNFPKTGVEKIYTIRLVVSNPAGCHDTSTQDLKVLKTCYIAVPNAFSPNGDGLNDFLYPLNAYKADNLEFNVYNRFGQRVFHTTDWTRKWDGKINGAPQSTGTYVWTLGYTNHDTGKKVFLKGTTVLIR